MNKKNLERRKLLKDISIPKIPKPSIKEVEEYLKNWNNLENYVFQEKALNLLFKKYPENKEIEHILIKVCCLNQFYSTGIFSPFIISKHIQKLNIDQLLSNNNLEIVDKIAKTKVAKGKIINFYSFASKYCSHHKPKHYPIYDYFVEKILMYFKRKDNFYEFKKDDIHNYKKFNKIVKEFKKFYKIDKYNVKEIDIYLWQIGKEYFPRKYK